MKWYLRIILAVFILSSFCLPGSVSNSSVKKTRRMASGDMYYEYSITSKMNYSRPGAAESGTRQPSTMKLYISGDGHVRVERDLNFGTAGQGKSIHMIILAYTGKPGESIMINESQKTYSIIHIDSLKIPANMKMESNVTKIGDEKVMGYSCVHAKIISVKQFGSVTSNDTLDIWKSPDVPLPSKIGDWMKIYENKFSGFMYAQDVQQKLNSIGCRGMMVKMQIRGKNIAATQELVKAEHQDLPASLFEIPAGYTETKEMTRPF